MKETPTTKADIFRLVGEISVKFATLDFFVTLVIDKLGGGAGGPSPNTALGGKFGYIRDVSPSNTSKSQVLLEHRRSNSEALAVAELRNRFLHDQLVFDESLLASGKVGRVKAGVAKNPDGTGGYLCPRERRFSSGPTRTDREDPPAPRDIRESRQRSRLLHEPVKSWAYPVPSRARSRPRTPALDQAAGRQRKARGSHENEG